jgi:hypothetical protein
MKFKFIWIDDEYKKQDSIIELAELEDINIIPFTTARAGIDELKKNLWKYDGVILDAKGFKDSEDEMASLKGMSKAINEINKLSVKKHIPVAVYTGQPDLMSSSDFSDLLDELKCFKKGIETELMFNYLKEQAERQAETQIKNAHRRLFEFTEKELGDAAAESLFQIFSNNLLPDFFTDSENYFNPLRKIVEDLFRSMNKYKILPDAFVGTQVALNESAKFLSGSIQKDFLINEGIITDLTGSTLNYILHISQPGSHRSNLEAYVRKQNSPYLLLSITYQLADVIIWYEYFLKNKLADLLKLPMYKEQGLEIGEVKLDPNGNFHCNNKLLSYNKIQELSLKPGDSIALLKTITNTKSFTKDIYSEIVLDFKKIEEPI